MALVGVAGRDGIGPMREFVDRHGLAGLFPHVADVDGSVWQRFGVGDQPAWVFVDEDGEAEHVFGALTDEDLAAHLEALEAS